MEVDELPPLDRQLPIVTTRQAARHLQRRGFDAARPLDVRESHEEARGHQRLRITAMPGRHELGLINVAAPGYGQFAGA